MVKTDRPNHRSQRPLELDGKSEPASDVANGNRNNSSSLHGAHHGEFPGQKSPIHFLLLALGFTLVELLIAICIIGALAAIAIPNYFLYIEKAKTTKVISEMKILENEILLYAMDNDSYPVSLADIGRDGVLDPWDNPYRYLNISTAKGKGGMRKDRFLVPINSDFDLYSMGPDGRSVSPLTSKLSHDDIIRASNGTYFGVASGY